MMRGLLLNTHTNLDSERLKHIKSLIMLVFKIQSKIAIVRRISTQGLNECSIKDGLKRVDNGNVGRSNYSASNAMGLVES